MNPLQEKINAEAEKWQGDHAPYIFKEGAKFVMEQLSSSAGQEYPSEECFCSEYLRLRNRPTSNLQDARDLLKWLQSQQPTGLSFGGGAEIEVATTGHFRFDPENPEPEPKADTSIPRLTNVPQKIYLNVGDIEPNVSFEDLEEVTWSPDRIFPLDIEYTLSATEPKAPSAGVITLDADKLENMYDHWLNTPNTGHTFFQYLRRCLSSEGQLADDIRLIILNWLHANGIFQRNLSELVQWLEELREGEEQPKEKESCVSKGSLPKDVTKRITHIWSTANPFSAGNLTESYNSIMGTLKEYGRSLPSPTPDSSLPDKGE